MSGCLGEEDKHVTECCGVEEKNVNGYYYCGGCFNSSKFGGGEDRHVEEKHVTECCGVEEKYMDGYYYCGGCLNLLDDLSFDNVVFYRDGRFQTRIKKFMDVLLASRLGWYETYTLLELFPKVERYFVESERINFINMSQLAIELCRCCCFMNYVDRLMPLKTKMRIRQVEKFVDDAMDWYFGGCVVGVGEEMELIELKAGYIDFSKVVNDNHLFTDRDSIDAAKKS